MIIRTRTLAVLPALFLTMVWSAGCSEDCDPSADETCDRADSGRSTSNDGGSRGDASRLDATVVDGSSTDGGSVDAAREDGSRADANRADSGVVTSDELVGWASVEGDGVPTTTGGGDAAPMTVDTAGELSDALSGSTPRVIRVSGSIEGNFEIRGSNLTIEGLPDARITGSIQINDASNIIMRDLIIVGWNCSDDACGEGADAIVVRESNHIWFDHLDISDGSDGNLDVRSASDLITISWTKFHYSAERDGEDPDAPPHRFANLVGNDNDDTNAGRLRVTFHHCWWADRVDQRMPRVAWGRVHVLNNLYTATDNTQAIIAAPFGNVLVENNVFIGIHHPVRPRGDRDDRADLAETALLVTPGNIFRETSGDTVLEWNPDEIFDPPYDYTADDAEDVEAMVRAGAGPRW